MSFGRDDGTQKLLTVLVVLALLIFGMPIIGLFMLGSQQSLVKQIIGVVLIVVGIVIWIVVLT